MKFPGKPSWTPSLCGWIRRPSTSGCVAAGPWACATAASPCRPATPTPCPGSSAGSRASSTAPWPKPCPASASASSPPATAHPLYPSRWITIQRPATVPHHPFLATRQRLRAMRPGLLIMCHRLLAMYHRLLTMCRRLLAMCHRLLITRPRLPPPHQAPSTIHRSSFAPHPSRHQPPSNLQ